MASIERAITRERLTPYLGATAGDLSKALELYEANIQLSEAMHGLLHGLEVTVRNAEHYALTASYGTPTWYDAAPLAKYWRDQIANAKSKSGSGAGPGKVVAGLTFGFWVDLLQKQNHWPLWVGRKLHAAFPNAKQRSVIHERLKALQLLRNRIAHHARILTSGNALYAGNGTLALPEVLECAEWVCAETAEWMRSQFRYADARAHTSGSSRNGRVALRFAVDASIRPLKGGGLLHNGGMPSNATRGE